MNGQIDAMKDFEVHRSSVYAWAFRLLRNHHDAMDATQEVFVKWWQAQRIGHRPDHLPAWLRRVTINQSISLLRNTIRRAKGERLAKSSPVEFAEAKGRNIARAVGRAMEEMSEQQRAVLFAKVFDGCTFATIADQMELSVPTVKTHYLRALKAVRRVFASEGIVDHDDA